jgi:hypothetical protein
MRCAGRSGELPGSRQAGETGMKGWTSLRAAGLAVALAATGASASPPARAADEPDSVRPAPAATDATAPAAPTAKPVSAAASRRWARGVWFDLRGRAPTPAELDGATAVEPGALLDRLLAEPATWEAWLDRELYYYLLIDRFRPVSDRVLALPGRLASGEVSIKDATREIVVSVEFNARNPGNDTFVTVVLEQLLGIVVQKDAKSLDAGKKMYDGVAARLFGELGRTQSDVVRIVLGRKEFAERLVERQYRQVFGRAPSKEDLARDAARFHEDPASFRAILREWLLSDAYRARTAIPRPKGDLVFIRTLFTDLLGRDPTFDEFRNSRNAFTALSDPAPIRNVIAQLLLESGRAVVPEKAAITKPGEWVRGEFQRLLGRDPTVKEVDAFVGTLAEYGCEPRTIVLTIVTSPEYQYY